MTNNGQKLNFLLDSGSSACYIDEKYLELLNYQDKGNYINDISGFGGNHQYVAKIIKMTLSGKYHTFTQDFYTYAFTPFEDTEMDLDEPIHGILGSDFMYKNSVQVDYKHCKFYLK